MFIGQEHKNKLDLFLHQDGTYEKDIERKALFYIFAGNNELADKIHHFYDFEERMIRIEGFNETSLSSSSKSLVKLGFNLYNNYPCGTVVELLGNLDEQNQILALSAIKLRFVIE
ncbi:DUF6075 family protein [Ferdinandcohnia quinoae]|uniref:DUF6075 family protein n=1 Tax=Fredinandcohnia quinoae TaxID=2918902 RepID=A0AAW5E6W5_9BACI|nr:DUF6075 family protein [Fredinandcohnia sp. SECRCQ15]MCH1627239.1 DUF6075 family protein [Fredinandcohnia sp. SECRCQ15]